MRQRGCQRLNVGDLQFMRFWPLDGTRMRRYLIDFFSWRWVGWWGGGEGRFLVHFPEDLTRFSSSQRPN